jgi:hypothetical protein
MHERLAHAGVLALVPTVLPAQADRFILLGAVRTTARVIDSSAGDFPVVLALAPIALARNRVALKSEGCHILVRENVLGLGERVNADALAQANT